MLRVGRILLVIVMVIGVILVAAGTASLVVADSWTGQIDDIKIDSGVYIGGWAEVAALEVTSFALNIIMKLISTNSFLLPAF